MTAFRIWVTGRVQGVGFRPFVVRRARAVGLCGTVMNAGGIVEVFVEGSRDKILSFAEELKEAQSPISVETLRMEEALPVGFSDFRSIESGGTPCAPVFPADIGLCDDCRRELSDAADRHCRYPFLSCTACGPRYTIVKNLPYDRERTTMARFALCDDCAREYSDVADRRCHGETIACPACGPQLFGRTREAELAKEAALAEAIRLLRRGAILLVKAMGGYQLLCRGDDARALRRLRHLKHRAGKPFALLFPDIQTAEAWVHLDGQEIECLASPVRPILLARPKRAVLPEVCEDVPRLGVMLPSTGLYALLAEAVSPLVVTSANLSGEPIFYCDAEAETFFETHEDIAGFFGNDREILRPADDSVAKVTAGRLQVLRRTRGFLPEPIPFSGNAPPILATGADTDPGFCLAAKGRLYPAQIPCHWESERAAAAVAEAEADWESMLGLSPAAVVIDRHPGYFSSAWGRALSEKRNLPLLTVQHHHAHALSVMAEHNLRGPALAFVFDGSGYGDDGTVWGGEILLCEGAEMRRVGHLRTIPMLGGDVSIRQAWKSAYCYMHAAGLAADDPRYETVSAALSAGVNTIGNSGMGRLFDAAAALLLGKEENRFKGECPMALEAAATMAKDSPPLLWEPEETEAGLSWDGAALLRELLAAKGTPAEKALAFHRAIIEMVVRSAKYFQVSDILLSGGCFANHLLAAGCREKLEAEGFRVYTNEKVPCGDGGLSLGQAYYAALA